jgi:integrase
MGYQVFYGDSSATTAAGFGKVAHLPCIFDLNGGYHRLSSRYLIDRGLGVWDPKHRGRIELASPPTPQSIKNFAYWLVNFLDWLSDRSIALTECDFIEDVQRRYQVEMLQGIWSRDGRGLKPSTVNLRVQQACDFLCWLSDKGHRNPTVFQKKTIAIKSRKSVSSSGHRIEDIEVRAGRVSQPDTRLRMPTKEQVRNWINDVYTTSGYSRGLMCETILLTGVRREEVSCWRIDTLPDDRNEWYISNPLTPAHEQQVKINITFGAKGRHYGTEHGDKIGPDRSILIPLHLAVRLHEYRMILRNPALKAWMNSTKSTSERRKRVADAVHLFRDEKTGARITSKDLYRAWTRATLPFRGWSPHQGRHWWACTTLWAHLKRFELHKQQSNGVDDAKFEMNAMSIIKLHIQPQLGHSSENTTYIYLQWIADMMGIGLSIRYEMESESFEMPIYEQPREN